MKTFYAIALSLFFSLQSFSQNTGNIYGLNFTASTLKLAELNPDDGTVDLINDNALSGDQFSSGNSDLDPNLGRYHYVRFGQMITADLETGDVLFSPQLTCTTLEIDLVNPISNIAYNWVDSTIYGLVHTEDLLYFAKVNPETGIINILSDGPVSTDQYSSGVCDIDPLSGRYFYIRSNKIVTVSITSGQLVSQVTIENPNGAVAPITNIAYNWLTGMIYGLNFVAGVQNDNTYVPAQLRLATVNPENGNVTILSETSLSSDQFSSGVSDIDPMSGRYYYIRGNGIYTVDIATGELISNFSLSNPNNAIVPITNIGVFKDKITQPAPISDFTMDNEDLSVSFKNTSHYNLSTFWDFGDGNSSTNRHANHIFAEGGTYEVMLVSESWGGDLDTTYQTIEVEDATLSTTEEVANEMLVYPNPAMDRVWIKTGDNLLGGVLRVFSMDGKLVFEENLATNLVELNTSNFQAGIYVIATIASDGITIRNERLVVKP